ncbi:Beta-glucosidase 1 [Sphaceloma murrayae]|uniref:Probable beta-glucosidase I n=1 Tax=Sphaceloma murrayae TaxID=2082308 RepID=A0A2K1QI89_9PEZI|nr:Beta-glucosidase 1 [Sphaceloma murrayae]
MVQSQRSQHAEAASKVLAQLTQPEKISLVSGVDFWHTASIPRLNIPALRMSDGPNGIRGTKLFDSVPAACLPCGTGLGATWDTDLLREAGELIARECRAKSAHIWLGPTINIQRSPLGGRGFESFSEDPVLSGTMAAAIITAVQNRGIASSLKHFVANDMEHERSLVDCVISDRALREIYLLPFQIAIRDSQPWSIMTAFNRVNGQHMSENKRMLQDLVRDEWGWKGCVTSDWYGTYSTVEAMEAGLDIEMPGPPQWRDVLIARAISSGKMSVSTLDARATSVLELVEQCREASIPERGPEALLDTAESRTLLRKLAGASTVLLKNENQVLPLQRGVSTAIIGPTAKRSFFCGGGSASLRPYRAVSIFDAVSEQLSANVLYSEGCQIHNYLPPLGDKITSPSGKKGVFEMHMYGQPPEEGHKAIETLELDDTNIMLYDYANPAIKGNICYAVIEADLEVEHTDTYIFGVAVAGTGLLMLDDKIVVDNKTKQRRGESFFASGSVEETGRAHLEAGKKYKLKLLFGSAATSNLNSAGAPVFGFGGVRFGFTREVDPVKEIQLAVEAASAADQVVLCIGLGPDWESEGNDRALYGLPGAQDELIKQVCAANPKTAVVIQTGTPVSGPWEDCPAIMQSWYGGNECGNGVADALFGLVNPSGKLPLSWPKAIEDNPAFLSFASEAGKCHYNEGIFVGYRFYEKTKRAVQWPFGHGLSYADFNFENMDVQLDTDILNGQLKLSVTITNTSTNVDGSEVCQIYVSRTSQSDLARSVKDLKGFSKVAIPAGESRVANMTVSIKYAVSVWDELVDAWRLEAGDYKIYAGSSSSYTPLSGNFNIPETMYWKGL